MLFVRVLEIILFSIMNFVPYLFLAILPFFDKFRFTKKTNLILLLITASVQIFFGLLETLIPGEAGKFIVNLLSQLVYVIFYLIAIKAHFGKKLFVLLMLSNVANVVMVCSKYFEGQFFPNHAEQDYRWTLSFVMLFVQAVLLSPLVLLMKGQVRLVAKSGNVKIAWWYLWLIPATFYLVWLSHLYAAAETPTHFALNLSNVLFLFFINLGAFLIYYVVLLLIREQEKTLSLEESNYMLGMQALQYENLHEKIREARQAKHDIRHHITSMLAYIDNGEYDKLKEYLNSYRRSLPDDSKLQFCPNHAVNVLLLYFAQTAKTIGADFVVNVRLPDRLGLPDNDVSVCLGNLLENAVDACSQQKGVDKKIVVGANHDGNALYITVDNTFENEIKRDRFGCYLSTKHKGAGIGTESVKSIAERYHGSFFTEQKDGVFYASVMLKTG